MRRLYLPIAQFVLLALSAIGSAHAQLPEADLPIQLDADSSDFDRRNSRLIFRKIRVSQGAFAIRADQADSADLEFRDSNWTFSGNVRIDAPQARIDAETATLKFSGGRLVAATIEGQPANFAQTGERPTEVMASEARLRFSGSRLARVTLEGKPAVFSTVDDKLAPTRGEAGSIDYDVGGGVLTLSDNAWLQEGDNRISGNRIAYDMSEERVVADSGDDGSRVHITIIPPPVDKLPGDTDDNTPDPPP